MSEYNEAMSVLLRSHRLPDAVVELSRVLRDEARRRQEFYEWMTDDMKVEFIDGEIVMHSPARNAHLVAAGNLSFLMKSWALRKKLGPVKYEKCLCVFPRNDYEPDIVFFTAARAAQFTDNTMKFPVPDLIVEVLSESTEKRDRGVKFEDYQAHGVREYWIVDTWKQTIEQYLLRGGKFEVRLHLAADVIVSEILTGFRIPVRAIFDDAETFAVADAMRD